MAEGTVRNRQRTVLVTGAAGFIGVPVVRRLLAGGVRVIAVDDGSAGTLDRLSDFSGHSDVVVAVLDICHRADLTQLVAAERPHAVVHLAARHFVPDCEQSPAATLEVNVMGIQHLLDACAAHPPQRLVFASTADVYAASIHPHAEDDPVAPRGVYGCSKLIGERLLTDQAHRLGSCDIQIARLFNVYGPGDGHRHLLPEVLRQAWRGTALHLGDVDAARDFVYVEDAAEALVALLHTPRPGVLNIGTGHSVSGRELVDLVGRLLGRPLQIKLDRSRLRQWRRPASRAVPTRLRGLLPWWPRTRLDDGVLRTIRAMRRGQDGDHLWRAS